MNTTRTPGAGVLATCLPFVCAAFWGCPATPPPEPGDGIAELLDQANSEGEVEAEVTVDVTTSVAAPPEPLPEAPTTPRPVILEFEARTRSGAPFKGVLLSLDAQVGNADFQGPMIIRAQQIDFAGVTLLRGFAVAQDETGAEVQARRFAFLGVPIDQRLPSLEQPVAFDLDALGQYFVYCREEGFYGAANFLNPRTETKVPAILVARRPVARPCPQPVAVGTARSFLEGRSIETSMGTLYLGKGLVDWVEGARPSPFYLLGVPATLTDREINPGFNGRFRDRVRRVTPFDLAHLVEIRQGEMVFEADAPLVEMVQTGDILVAKPGVRWRNGFLRRVTEVREENGNTVVATQPAALSELVEEGAFDLERTLTQADLLGVQVLTEGAQVAEGSGMSTHGLNLLPIPSIELNKVIYDADGDRQTLDDQLRLSASVDLSTDLVVNFRCCADPYFRTKFSFDETAALTVEGTATWAGSQTFVPVSLTFAPIAIGPIVLQPVVKVKVRIEADVSGAFRYHVEQAYGFDAGVKFENGAFSPINNVSHTFSSDPVSITGSMRAEGRVSLEGSIRVYGAIGAGIDVGAYIGLEGEIPSDPLWELYAGVDGNVFAEIDLIVVSASTQLSLFDQRWTLEAAPNSPPEFESIYVGNMEARSPNGIRVYAGAPGQFRIRTMDLEDGPGCCQVTLVSRTDGTIGTTDDVEANPITFQFDTEGVRTVAATVTDSQGASTEMHFDVEVLSAGGVSSANLCWGFEVTPIPIPPFAGPTWEFRADVTRWGTEYGMDSPRTQQCQAFDTAPKQFTVNWYVDGNLVQQGDVFDANNQSVVFRATFDEKGTHQVRAVAFNQNAQPVASDVVMAVYGINNPLSGAEIGGHRTLESPGGDSTLSSVPSDEVPTNEPITMQVEGDAVAEAEEIVWYDQDGNVIGTGDSVDMTFEEAGTQTITAELTDQDTGTTAEAEAEMTATPQTGMGGYYNTP